MENKNEKKFLGMPMNWDQKRIFKTMWNKEDDLLFPPKAFGIGWTINFRAVLKAAGVISGNESANDRKDKK